MILFSDCGRDGLRVTVCSHAAAARGVTPGMRLAEAEGLCGGGNRTRSARPRFVRHNADDDRQALCELAGACQEFSPVVGVAGADSLVLDVTGCAHLFGGEEGLLRQVDRALTRRGLEAVTALAGTIGAAWAFARYAPHPGGRVVSADEQRRQLAALPVAALRLPDEALDRLDALGLRRIAQLLALPRASLPSRIGPEVLQRLDQALGDAPELIVPVRPQTPVSAAVTFPAPTADRATLECALRDLVEQVAGCLSQRCVGVQQLEVRLDGGPGVSPVSFPVGTAQPTASADHLAELVLTRLEQTPLAGEVHGAKLTVRHSAPLETRQPQLFEEQHAAAHRRELARLVDRLSNRLGKQRVVRPQLHPDVLPEYALRWQPVLDGAPPALHAAAGTGLRSTLSTARPLHLFAQPRLISVVAVVPDGPPRRFDHLGRSYGIRHAWGPERLSAGWWRGRGGQVARDYYRVETEAGQRFWLFRRIREGDWYLHGEFD